MFRSFSAIACVALLAISCGATALVADSWAEPDIRAAQIFQKVLKNNDRKAIARMVSYPVVQDFPLPRITTAKEFLAHWDEFFDRSNTEALLRSRPAQVAWRGVTLANGLVWFNNGQVFTLNLRTDLYRKRLEEAKKRESALLYPSARGYKNVQTSCDTRTKHIRVQEHGDGFHYFVWPKGANLSLKPELELKGTLDVQGSAGNELYTFRNGGFRYEFYSPRICESSNCPDTLTVFHGEQEISNQTCR